MNTKMHGRENDSVEVVPEAERSEVALREEIIQRFWEEHDIFNKTLETPAGEAPKGDYVFYDGPPFATGLPHYGHILAGTIKDAVPRFWTMNGYRVRRTWGWDCHGLPLENLIEKKLGLATKRDIEAYGIQKFNEAARGTVMEYADDWRQIIPRMGRWADMENDYKTMDSTYTESVWWVFKSLHEKGLVYEGFKSMHLCPRCGTTLSNFEVNQGYKDIKDIAVTVKLPLLDAAGNKTDTSLLVWTTTPWTLPGNMAAAVHTDFEYVTIAVKTEEGAEQVILAKGRLAQLGDLKYEVIDSMRGSDLVGRKYEPPFPYYKDRDVEGKDNAWTIYHADYVELGEEGTGAVHLAPAYGEDDMNLAKEHGVPIEHHVDADGHFMDFVTDFAGQLVKPKDDDESGVDHKDADIEILKALQAAGKIFKKENITHSYPHCWRCDTPLLNYATTSWFVEVTKFKDELVEANTKVHWVPEHVGKNRFGKWLEGARDWAVSRQRYWGAPLPIWRNPKTKEYKVFGSLKEIQEYVPNSGNTYVLMRHGQAESNLESRISAQKIGNDPLTETGVAQVVTAAKELEHIDLIVHSGFLRTRMTAEIVAQELGVAPEAVLEDERLGELQAGIDLEGNTWAAYQNEFGTEVASFTDTRPGRENRFDVIRRVGQVLYQFEEKYRGKRILIVGHASSLFGLQAAAAGLGVEEAIAAKAAQGFMDNAAVMTLPFTPLPHNDDFTLDYHRPYIDDIALYDGEVRLERVPDVFDCWFESGSMPYADRSFAQSYSPFGDTPLVTVPLSTTPQVLTGAKDCLIANASASDSYNAPFPANFISESIDQTRGWFYSTMVLGVALFGKSPFQNVVTNGLVLAEDGRKMSKSLQNYPDPMELVARQGADAMRFYLLSSSIIKAEDLNFSEKEVQELQRKNIGRLHNVLAMYEQYAPAGDSSPRSDLGLESEHVLDRWIIARLNQLIAETTAGYQKYELDKATRPITDFIDDLSVWYLRRSRDRLKSDDVADKQATLATLRHVLKSLSLVMAPVMPFYAEYLWQAVREDSDATSVHLGAWPDGGEVDQKLLTNMGDVRTIVSHALEQRTKSGIKVRQPLPLLRIEGMELSDECKELIKDEVNVKSVESKSIEKELTYHVVSKQDDITDTTAASQRSAEVMGIFTVLDTKLTPELIAEGAVRELMRAVQGRRKTEGFAPEDRIELTVTTDETGKAAIEANRELLTKTVGADTLAFAETDEEEIIAGEYTFVFSITKK